MKKSILFVLFALVSVAVFSQISWNAKVGMNISNWTEDEAKAKVGFKAGVGMEYAFNDMWLLQPSLLFSTKGAKAKESDAGFNLEATINQMYLELPIMAAARFKVADNTNIVISAGPYLAYGVGGKTKMSLNYEGEKGEIKFNTFGDIDKVTLEYGGKSQDIPLEDLDDLENINSIKGLNRFDFGLGIGVAAEFNRFVVGLDGQLGLTKLYTDGGKNQNFSITVGYKF